MDGTSLPAGMRGVLRQKRSTNTSFAGLNAMDLIENMQEKMVLATYMLEFSIR